MPVLSAVVITKDEEKNIAGCLAHLSFCDEIVVVDSGSRDRTRLLASNLGAKILEKNFTDFASQKNYGIDRACGDWILSIDADERVSSELAGEIQNTLRQSPRVDGYYLPRQNRIFGRWMRFGINEADWQLRLVRKGRGCFQGLVHERIRVAGVTRRLRGALLHDSTPTVSAYMAKLNFYTSLEARHDAQANERPAERRMRWKPLATFFYQAILKKGVLDGCEGFVFAALSAYYEFVRCAKRWELVLAGAGTAQKSDGGKP